jgi:hypothetical protein
MRDDEETQLRPNLDQCFAFIDAALATDGGVLVHWYARVITSKLVRFLILALCRCIVL